MTSITSITFAPLLPPGLIVGLAVLAALVIAFGAWRGGISALWRAVALALILLALTNPSLVREQRDMIPDIAVTVVDQSPSQAVGNRTARSNQALAEIERRLANRQDLEHRTVFLKSSSEAITGLVDGTALMATLERALSDVPKNRLAGVILITDGQVHDMASVAGLDPGGPIHLLLSGEPDERDRRLTIDKAPNYGIVGEALEIVTRVQDESVEPGTRVQLTISQDGRGERRHLATVGQATRIPVILDHGGATVLELRVEAGEDELTEINNRMVLMVNGVRDRMRVLLVSGQPHAGERTWRNLLKADPSVDLVHFTILRPPEKQDGTPIKELSLIAFPTRELFQAKLTEFDLVIFDRYHRRGVLPDTYLRNVVDYVNQGGAVLTAAGPAFASSLSLHRTPLSQVLPSRPTGSVEVGGFIPRLTRLGQRHPVTAALPGSDREPPAWGRWFRMIDVEQLRGTRLMSGVEDRPMLILDRVGQGRVAQLLSDHAWLWARGYEGGGPQAELLRRISHWLMKEPDLEEEDLSASAAGNVLRIARRSLDRDGGQVTIEGPDGKTRTLVLEQGPHGIASAQAAVDKPGLYRLSDGRRRAVAAVGTLNPKEYADLRTSDRILRPLVEATGGGVFWLGDGQPELRRVRPERAAYGRGWLGLVAHQDYRVIGVERTSLAPTLITMLLLVGLSMLAWHREGR